MQLHKRVRVGESRREDLFIFGIDFDMVIKFTFSLDVAIKCVAAIVTNELQA